MSRRLNRTNCPTRARTGRYDFSPKSPPSPRPIAATYSTGSGQVHVQFDRNLTVSFSIDGANWGGCSGEILSFGTGTAFADTVTFSVTSGAGCSPPFVTYSGGDENLKGANGTPIAAFTDYPLTVV
ncbi:MAG: hypothetical protein MI923_09840 [Phycisphaerales bacterium]|nr:hypothetical protein [Phycisphaerales bacterium]